MAVKTGKRYTGRVVEGRFFESQRNTPGFQLLLDCEDGSIDYPIWLTAKNRDKARRDFATLGVEPGQLTDRSFMTYQLPQIVQGVEVMFEARSEEYPQGSGTMQTKVAWIGKPSAGGEEAIAANAVALFGGSGAAAVGYSRDAGEPADLSAALEDDAPPF